MSKNKMSLLFFGLLMLAMTACGSGGGGTAGSNFDPSNGGGIGGGTGGGTGADNAQAAYYGFATDSVPPILNQNSISGGTLLSIPNEVAINIRIANSRNLDVLIYQPTCVLGFLSEEYTATLIYSSSSSNLAPTVGTVTVTASTLSFQEHSVAETGGMSATVYDYGSAVSYSGICASGEMSLNSSGGTLFSNGKLMVWKNTAGDIYVGAIKTSIVSSSSQLDSSSAARSYLKFSQIFTNALSPNSPLTTWQSPNTANIETSNLGFFSSKGVSGFGGQPTSASTSRASLGNVGTAQTAVTFKLGGSSSSESPFYGFGVSSVGTSGKALVVVSARKSAPSAVFSNSGVSNTDVKGSGSIMIFVQN